MKITITAQSWGRREKRGACKWNSSERRLRAQSSCHNTQNNNYWKPLKPFTANRYTSLCKEWGWEVLGSLTLLQQSRFHTWLCPTRVDHLQIIMRCSSKGRFVWQNNYLCNPPVTCSCEDAFVLDTNRFKRNFHPKKKKDRKRLAVAASQPCHKRSHLKFIGFIWLELLSWRSIT